MVRFPIAAAFLGAALIRRLLLEDDAYPDLRAKWCGV